MKPGERLQLWRNNHHMKVSELAMRIGVSQATIYNFESGKTRVNSDVLEHLHIVGVNIDWLLCGEGDMDCYSSEFLRHIISTAEDLSQYRLGQLLDCAEYLLYLEEKDKNEKSHNK